MSSAPRKPLRIFISSPGDVNYERAIARDEIARLAHEAGPAEQFDLQVVSWDDPDAPAAMLANQAPQSALRRQLVDPADCDLVIVIFWSRMGTPLTDTDFRKKDGSPYLSGTEWEFENALNSKSRPDILVYRRMDIINVDPEDAQYEASIQQQALVNRFFKQFVASDGAMNGFHHKYKGVDGFRDRIRKDILGVLRLRADDLPMSAAPADTVVAQSPRWKVNPYRGLAAYSEDYAEVFCGREQEINALLDKLGTRQNCLAVVGASGSGKSSLISGGVLPRLKKSALLHSDTWVVHTIKPALVADPVGFLRGADRPNSTGEFHESQSDVDTLVDDYLARHARSQRLIVFVDQAEELLNGGARKIAAYAAAIQAFTASPRVTLLLACRSDLYGDWLVATGLQVIFQSSTFMLAPPASAGLIDIIRRPARMAGIEVDDRVVGEILQSVEGNAGALPLISYLMGQLYESAGASRRFDHAAYLAVGGIDTVVSQGADRCFELLTADQQRCFDGLFALLVTIDARGRVSRVACPVDQIARDAAVDAVLSAFVDARLLTLLEGDDGRRVAEISHESLITHWGRLANLVEQQAQHIRWRNSFRLGAQRWRDEDHSDVRLLQGQELVAATLAVARADVKLDGNEQAFIDASIARREAIRRKAQRIQFIQATGVIMSLLMTCIAVWIVLAGFQKSLDLAAASRAQSSVQALALALSQQGGNADLIELTLAAEFDTGAYEQISVVGKDAEPLASRRRELAQSTAVPAWFSRVYTPSPVRAVAQVTSGWSITGQLMLVPDRTWETGVMWTVLVSMSMFFAIYLSVTLAIAAAFLARHRALVKSVE